MYSLAPQIKSSFSGFYKALKPLANAYAQAAGFRQVGLRYDDILIEEREDVQKVSRNRGSGPSSSIHAIHSGDGIS